MRTASSDVVAAQLVSAIGKTSGKGRLPSMVNGDPGS
jgi:hypothetical protein